MATYEVHSIKALHGLLRRHMRSREQRIRKAAVRTAKHGCHYIIQFTVPIAFRELEGSIHVELEGGGAQIVADAPHAAAVEFGSRPHWPPIAPIERWVKLRGAQALKPRRSRGTTSAEHANSIGGALKAMERGGAIDIGAPRQIAYAVAAAIAKHGTKPQWYMRAALPEIRQFLRVQLKLALPAAGEVAMETG